MSRSRASHKDRPLVKFQFVTAWLVWDYDYDYGPESSDRYFSPMSSKVFLRKEDADAYIKDYGHGSDLDEIQCVV